MTGSTSPALAVAAIAAALTLPSASHAAELQAELGLNGVASTWAGDGGAGSQVRVGLRAWRWVTVDFAGWNQLLTVDQRNATGITFGIAATYPSASVRPSVRLYAVHQHEEGWVSVKENPWGTLFGIGAGIRHRAGGGLTAAVEAPFATGRFGEYYAFANANATWFPDASLGPSAFYGAALGVGTNYALDFK